MKKLIVPFLCFLLFSCEKEEENKSTFSTNTINCNTISYKTEIAPMMNTYCVSCHSSSNASGGINLSTYSTVATNASRSLNSIKSGSMPPIGSIPDSLIQKLNCWIIQGKLNN